MLRFARPAVLALAAFVVAFSTTRYAQAHYGSSYQYYHADAYGEKGYIVVSGQWSEWTGNVRLLNTSIRLQVLVPVYWHEFGCWYVGINGDWGDFSSDSGFQTIGWTNSLDHSEYFAFSPIGPSDAIFEGSVSSEGGVGCSYYTVTSGMYNGVEHKLQQPGFAPLRHVVSVMTP
jgi:hypothetical protein